ncbi:hypothetical protein [Arcticibacter sp. MXS-1]|uniref:hypothetical protein n=1 Tax=Arcticibacter sp. MXS-1 TaxID=3341726 RepID=UPI0035A82BE2
MRELEENLNGRIVVPDEFQEVFSHFYFAENRSSATITRTLMPSYQTIMIFSFGINAYIHQNSRDRIEVQKCIVLGPVRKAFEYSLPPTNRILVANFKDDAFYRFFGAAAIADHLPIDPDSLVEENCFTVLWHKLNELVNREDQVRYILDFSRPYLKSEMLLPAS